MKPPNPSIAAAPSQSPRFHRVITRHPGGADWVLRQLSHELQVVAHLGLDQVEPGGAYYGVLPLNLAAAICEQGSECWIISVTIPPELRGQELSARQLDELGAELVRYDVRPVARLRTGMANAV